MRLLTSLALTTGGLVLIACGGGVVLGSVDSHSSDHLTGDGSTPPSGDGGTSEAPCTDQECGFTPPFEPCDLGQDTQAHCGRTNGKCGWQRVCVAKGNCSPSECGPPVPMPSCGPGTKGGAECLRNAGGVCTWQNNCAPDKSACFDNDGGLDEGLVGCGVPSDCVVVNYQQDCCGTIRAAGVSTSAKATVEACAGQIELPACACPTFGTVADDGTHDATGTKPVHVSCVNQRCFSTYN